MGCGLSDLTRCCHYKKDAVSFILFFYMTGARLPRRFARSPIFIRVVIDQVATLRSETVTVDENGRCFFPTSAMSGTTLPIKQTEEETLHKAAVRITVYSDKSRILSLLSTNYSSLLGCACVEIPLLSEEIQGPPKNEGSLLNSIPPEDQKDPPQTLHKTQTLTQLQKHSQLVQKEKEKKKKRKEKERKSEERRKKKEEKGEHSSSFFKKRSLLRKGETPNEWELNAGNIMPLQVTDLEGEEEESGKANANGQVKKGNGNGSDNGNGTEKEKVWTTLGDSESEESESDEEEEEKISLFYATGLA